MARNNFAGVIIYVGYLRFISLRFLLCEEIIQEATQRETIDTAALRLFLCGLIQGGGCYFSGKAQFQLQFSQFRFKIFFFSVISYICTNGSYSTTSAAWFNYFSAYLKGIPHLRHSIVPQTSQFIQRRRIQRRRCEHLSCATFALFECHRFNGCLAVPFNAQLARERRGCALAH